MSGEPPQRPDVHTGSVPARSCRKASVRSGCLRASLSPASASGTGRESTHMLAPRASATRIGRRATLQPPRASPIRTIPFAMQRAIPPDVKAHGEGARLDPWPAIGHPTPVPQSPLLAPGGIRLGWREPALAELLYAL